MRAKRRKGSRCLMVTAVALLAATGTGRGDHSVPLAAEMIISSFDGHVEELRARYGESHADVRGKFMDWLKAEKETLTRRGDIEAIERIGVLMEKIQGGDLRIGEEEVDPDILSRYQDYRRRTDEICNRYCEDYREAVGKRDKALEQIKVETTRAGEIDEAIRLSARMEEVRSQDPSGLEGLPLLAGISLEGPKGVGVVDLRKGVNRLRGYHAPFSKVNLEGAQFTQVPWKGKPRYKVRVTRSGMVYAVFFRMPGDVFGPEGDKWIPVEGVLGGPYIKKVVKRLVHAGEVHEMGGYELCLVAGRIEKQ